MSYAVQNDLLTRITLAELTQLTDDAGAGSPNATVVQECLDDATAQIDSYVRTRYQTPLQPSNTSRRICIALAIYFVYTRRPQKMKETVRQAYDDAVAILKDISTGKASLDQPASAPTPQTSIASAVKPQHSHLRFGGHNLEGWD